MTTDWKELGKKIGSIQDGRAFGGDHYARIAFEEILGEEWIKSSVEHAIAFEPGAELAMNCLRYLHSEKAALYAYEIYKTCSGERASQAVWLIKQLAHPVSLPWVEEFLNDENVMVWGIGVLDKLLWEDQIPFGGKAEALLALAESKQHLKEQTDFIRGYVSERNIEN